MTLLIPLSYLNEACFISENLDEKKLKIALKIAHEDLEDVLGTELFNAITSQYSPQSGSDTLTVENATLYDDYIKDFLAWTTYFRFLGFSQSDSTPTGERSFEDENSKLLEGVAMMSKEKNVSDLARRYRDRMVNFLRSAQSTTSTAYSTWVDNCKDTFSFGFSCIQRDQCADLSISIYNKTTLNQ